MFCSTSTSVLEVNLKICIQNSRKKVKILVSKQKRKLNRNKTLLKTNKITKIAMLRFNLIDLVSNER